MDDPIKFCLDQAEQNAAQGKRADAAPAFLDLEARWLMCANRLDLTPT
jgi:hypothetical protein